MAAMAIGSAGAATASASVFADDTAVQFADGAPGATAVVEPGSVRLKPATEEFDGTSLAAGLTATQWDPAGTATVGTGVLTVDGVRVNGTPLDAPGQVLEFRATFSGAANQHVGLGNTFEDGPWAMFSTMDGSGLFVRTRATAGGLDTVEPIAGVVANVPHTYRIEWSPTDVKYYVDGTLVPTTQPPVAIASQMRPVVSDFTAGTGAVTVDRLVLMLFPGSGMYESRVNDAGDSRAVWGTLAAAVDEPSGTAVAIQTRSGNTPTPDATWSAYQSLGAGGAIQSPSGRYIQYRATLSTSDEHVTPSLNRIDIGYEIDTTEPVVASTFNASSSGAGSSLGTSDKTKPDVTVVSRSLRASKRGTVGVRVGCPATEERCKVTLVLKNGHKSAARKTVTVKGGKTVTVTLKLNKATRLQLSKHSNLKVSAVVTATDAAGNRKTTTRRMTLRRAAG